MYFDIKSEEETTFSESLSADQLRAHFEEHCERFLDWADRELAHRERRDRWLTSLSFPFDDLRAGQRQMAEAVYRAAVSERPLMIQAPTGIGKTLGTLFPLLKAMPRKAIDKVYFLVAKTSGRALVLDALRHLESGFEGLRAVEMVAKESACEHPGRACEAVSCPLARGFYDRLGAARQQALNGDLLDRSAMRRVALEHQICPYYFNQELARWCDVIVGDYNYFFDTSAILHALAVQNEWRLGVLVDEAHNLLSRARDMYSATLSPAVLDAAVQVAPAAVKGRLRQVRQGWAAIHRVQVDDYAVHEEIPSVFLGLLQQAMAAIADELAADPANALEPLLRFHFDAIHFCRMAEEFGSHSLFDVTVSGADAVLCIRNVDPGRFLAPRFASATTSVLFSATFAPADFYRRLLGFPPQVAWLNVGSPFDESQLEVRVEPRISTRYRDRATSLDPIVELMADQYERRPGNYLAFLSSFDYLKAVLERFKIRHPAVPVWEQVRGMGPAEREAFLARFTLEGRGIGFAVLGGAFAEGVDLPGDRLIGAFIATLGLPQVNEVNAQMERRMQLLFGAGYEFTYLYPGLQKVVQAAGRVIRTPEDRGTVYLIDDRYRGEQVRKLLPDWWRVQCS